MAEQQCSTELTRVNVIIPEQILSLFDFSTLIKPDFVPEHFEEVTYLAGVGGAQFWD
jgi:hypothetical protein